MSNVIVMPGSKEYSETLAKVKTAKKIKREEIVDLVGHTLMLNTAVAQTFQCGGFQLGSRRPFAIVTEQAQQFPLRAALAAGKLIDVTGQDMTKGYKGKGGETSAITEEETGQKVFVTSDGHGNICIVAPKSKTEAKRFEREIRDNGRIISVDLDEQFSGLSGVIEEEIAASKPAKKAASKKKANVSSNNRRSRSRR